MNKRFTNKYKVWRIEVINNAGGKCERCESRTRLHAHHIKSWQDYPELRFKVSNGECVCYKCHVEIHPFMIKYEALEKKRRHKRAITLIKRRKLKKKRKLEIRKLYNAKKNQKLDKNKLKNLQKQNQKTRTQQEKREKEQKQWRIEFFGHDKSELTTQERLDLNNYIDSQKRNIRFERWQDKNKPKIKDKNEKICKKIKQTNNELHSLKCLKDKSKKVITKICRLENKLNDYNKQKLITESEFLNHEFEEKEI